MTSKTVTEVLNVMSERFTSGNSIPVERAFIKRTEWDAVIAELMQPVETTATLTPIESLLVEWWSTDMDNAELFNRAVRLSPALADAMHALPEKSE
jgi:hypothetical protein